MPSLYQGKKRITVTKDEGLKKGGGGWLREESSFFLEREYFRTIHNRGRRKNKIGISTKDPPFGDSAQFLLRKKSSAFGREKLQGKEGEGKKGERHLFLRKGEGSEAA